MIKKLDISSYGSFQDFEWNKNINRQFGRRNIIYGRNYSGKTTLSRIFRVLEKEKHHFDFKDGKFKLFMEDGRTVDQTQVNNSNLNVRVYNSDFIRDNLSVFYNDDGTVQVFTVLGEANIKIESLIKNARGKIQEIERKVGNISDKTGISGEITRLKKEKNKKENKLDDLLRNKAREIYQNEFFFKRTQSKRTYNIRDIKSEIDQATELTEQERGKQKKVLQDNIKSNVNYKLQQLEQFDINNLIDRIVFNA